MLDPTKLRMTRAIVAALRSIAYAARPRLAVPAAPRAVILRYGLAHIAMLPSPYPIHRGKLIEHIVITEAGTARLQGELPLGAV